MKTPCLLFISAAIIALGAPAAAQVALPNGPNRDLVAHICSACHDLGMVVGTADAAGRAGMEPSMTWCNTG